MAIFGQFPREAIVNTSKEHPFNTRALVNSQLNETYAHQVGLVNLGNTCYMNTGLQCLANTPELAKYFLLGYYDKEKENTKFEGLGGALSDAFLELLR